MAGSPWTQIQSVISMVIRHAHQQNTPPPMCITYHSEATLCSTTTILSSKTQGSTNFKAAFHKIQDYLKTCKDKLVVITFMTDGQETVNKPNEIETSLQQLKFYLNNCGKHITVHAIGYTSSHDINLLQKLKTVGTREGMYRYAESRGLEEKFMELFEWVDTAQEIMVNVNGVNITCQGEVNNGRMEVECWIPISNTHISQVTVTIGKTQHTLDVTIIPPNPIFIMSALGHLPITTQQELNSVQERINKIKLFGNGMTREDRQILMSIKGEIQERLDAYHQIMADLARTSTSNVTAVAKLQDLKYAHQFSKTSRKRRMDQRAAKNHGEMSQIDARLSALIIPSNAYDGLNVDEFTCFLTQANIQEMMHDSQDDVMGFGLLIERTEFVVDAPSMITIRSISTTIISKSACEDAIRHKIHVDGMSASQAHGGFVTTHWQNTASSQQDSASKSQPSQQSSSSRFTIGTSGECINAFLPLYICEAHAQRVMVLLKPLLGYFFALDPLAFKEDQYLAMFTILGTLLQRAHSERDEWILLEYKKMCRMVMPEAKKYLGYDLVEHFIASLNGRVKGSLGCQNVLTIIGWAYALIPDDNTIPSWLTTLRFPLIEEMIRRACDSMFHSAPKSLVDQHIRELLYGRVKDEKEEEKTQSEDPLISAVASLSIKHKDKMDEKYATWAKYKTGYKSYAVAQPKDENLEDEVKLATPQPTSLVIMDMNDMIRDKIQTLMTGLTDSWSKYISTALLRINMTPFDITHDCMILRPMLIQCLRLHSNDAVNHAITHNTYVDVRADTERVLHTMHESYQQTLELQHNNMIEHIRSLTTARRMMITEDIWSFVGRLMSSCPTRGGMVWDALLALCMDQTRPKINGYSWPLLEYKIRILFTGTLVNTKTEKEYDVLAQGQAWFADKRTCDRIHEILGDDAYLQLELSMRGRYCGHVYRISDIPNRHGHCNSNPYLPLRRKWGES